jgi:hypothetical protein
MLNFCSPEMIYSSLGKVAKSFSGPISRTVIDIMNNPRFIVTDRGATNFICEETKNSYSFIAPYWTPFETINWLSTRAMNKKGVSNCFSGLVGGTGTSKRVCVYRLGCQYHAWQRRVDGR